MPWFVGLTVGVAVLVVAAAANGLSFASPEKNPQTAPANSIRQESVVARGSPVTMTEAAAQLRMRLARAAINTLHIKEAQGRLIVEGPLQKRQSEVWTEIRSWFDQAYGANVLLVSNVDVDGGTHAPRIPLQAIWYGQPPYIITADGARFYEGAFVEGWSIAEIGEKELLLTKSGATVALKYP
jgi:hypothetical protein